MTNQNHGTTQVDTPIAIPSELLHAADASQIARWARKQGYTVGSTKSGAVTIRNGAKVVQFGDNNGQPYRLSTRALIIRAVLALGSLIGLFVLLHNIGLV